MATFSNSEGGLSVRNKINAAITTVDSLNSGDNLLMAAAERTKLAGVATGATANTGALADKNTVATADIDASAVTVDKIQDLSASRLLGRGSSGVGAPQSLTVGTNLSISGTVLNVDLSALAPLASPALTGTPTAPTAAPGTNTTQIASTAFVTAAVSAGGGGVADGDKGDITVSASGATWTIDNGVVTYAKMNAAVTGASIVAKVAIGGGAYAELAAPTNTVLRRVGGDLGFGLLSAVHLNNAIVSNAILTNVATATIKGRVTAGTGSPEDLTGTQATTLLDTFTTSLKGLAPASGGGTTNYLRADGTWAAPSGGSGITWSTPVDADILPDTNNTRDIGADLTRFAAGHFETLFVAGNAVTSLADPGADRIIFWDDSAGASDYLALGNGLSITTTTLNAEVSLAGAETLTNKTLTDPKITLTVNAQTGTTYTLVLTDAHKKITMSNASANTLTIPTNAAVAFPVGTVIGVSMIGAGATTVDGDTGVTVNGVSAGGAAISARYTGVTLTKLATDTWLMEGNHGTVA